MAAPRARTRPNRPLAKAAHSRPAERWKNRYALTSVAAVCVAMTVLGVSVHFGLFSPSVAANPSQQSASATNADETRAGKLVLQTEPEQCTQMKFDNTNGHFIEGLKPCENQIQFDEHGRPIPMGTIHRLDAISKSFFGH